MTDKASDLFLLMLNLVQLESGPTIKRIFCEAMGESFPGCSFSIHPESRDENHDIPLSTHKNSFGHLLPEGCEKIPPEEHSHIRNAARMLAVILEKRKQEELLKEEAMQHRFLAEQIMNLAPLPIYTLDIAKKCLSYANPAVHRLMKAGPRVPAVTEPEVFPRHIHPDDLVRVQGQHEKLKASPDDTAFTIDYRLVDFEGGEHHMRSIEAPYRRDPVSGETTSIVGFAVDLTEERSSRTVLEEKNSQLADALKEREVLLREIHHRVKNSLQLVSSLLELQKGSLAAEEDEVQLEECKLRIRSISRIHEELYGRSDLTAVEMNSFINNLTAEISGTFGNGGFPYKIEAESIRLPIDSAIPCALILNELVTNAFKYGLERNSRGELQGHISIRLFRDSGSFLLEVSDPGDGFDPEEVAGKGSLGMSLVTSLADQLDGSLSTRQRDERFAVELSFPEPDAPRAYR